MNRNKTIYRLTVEDIYLTAEMMEDDDTGEPLVLTDDIVERVIRKVEAMDFSDMSETLRLMIEDAIEERDASQK
jgi:hypothetical protein